MLETLATNDGADAVETPETRAARRPGGAFTAEELARIDELLRGGATNRDVHRAMGVPEATFYFRLKKSRKRILTPNRCLGDLQDDSSAESSGV
jgi:hypothetical protein